MKVVRRNIVHTVICERVGKVELVDAFGLPDLRILPARQRLQRGLVEAVARDRSHDVAACVVTTREVLCHDAGVGIWIEDVLELRPV